MTPHRILYLNATSTAACAFAMLATRGRLHSLFGLNTPLLLDVLAVALLVYAGALAAGARQQPISRATLMAFTIADGLWVAASVAVLLLFWSQFAPLARVLVMVGALGVEVFATLQFRAAGAAGRRSPQLA